MQGACVLSGMFIKRVWRQVQSSTEQWLEGMRRLLSAYILHGGPSTCSNWQLLSR